MCVAASQRDAISACFSPAGLMDMSRSVKEDFAALEEMKEKEETGEERFQVYTYTRVYISLIRCC